MPRRPPICAIFKSSCLEVRVFSWSKLSQSSFTCSDAKPDVFSTPVIKSEIFNKSDTEALAFPNIVSKKPEITLAEKTPRAMFPKLRKPPETRSIIEGMIPNTWFAWFISCRIVLKRSRTARNCSAVSLNLSVPGVRF